MTIEAKCFDCNAQSQCSAKAERNGPIDLRSGLPDGTFSNQKLQFWENYEGPSKGKHDFFYF
jgi:hypothetical protein